MPECILDRQFDDVLYDQGLARNAVFTMTCRGLTAVNAKGLGYTGLQLPGYSRPVVRSLD